MNRHSWFWFCGLNSFMIPFKRWVNFNKAQTAEKFDFCQVTLTNTYNNQTWLGILFVSVYPPRSCSKECFTGEGLRCQGFRLWYGRSMYEQLMYKKETQVNYSLKVLKVYRLTNVIIFCSSQIWFVHPPYSWSSCSCALHYDGFVYKMSLLMERIWIWQ